MRRIARLLYATAVAAVAAPGTMAQAQDPNALMLTGHGRHTVGVPCPPAQCPPAVCPPGTPMDSAAPAAPLAPLPPATDYASPEATPSFAGMLAGAGPGSTTAINPGGYIDGALPVTQVRLRGDFAYRNNRPDRAEFFYPKCGCFAGLTPPQTNAKGPPQPETGVDYQDVATYLEARLGERWSVFGEVPVRFLNPDVNANTSGLADVNFGFKYAAILTDTRIVTLQLRSIAPSGDGFKGLGSENWWVEPGILTQQQLTDRLITFGELRYAIPVSRTSEFAGDVLRYGVGAAYVAYSSCNLRVMPVVETVGWTVLGGKESTVDGPGAVLDASGATIVNLKGGVRFGFGEVEYPGALGRSDLYIGYGRALTGEVWYKDILRVEYRLRF